MTRLLLTLALVGLMVLMSWLIASKIFRSETWGVRLGRGGVLVSGATLVVLSAIGAPDILTSPVGSSSIYIVIVPSLIGLVLVWGAFQTFFRTLAWISALLVLIWAYFHLTFDVGVAYLLPGVFLVGAAIAASVPAKSESDAA